MTTIEKPEMTLREMVEIYIINHPKYISSADPGRVKSFTDEQLIDEYGYLWYAAGRDSSRS